MIDFGDQTQPTSLHYYRFGDRVHRIDGREGVVVDAGRLDATIRWKDGSEQTTEQHNRAIEVIDRMQPMERASASQEIDRLQVRLETLRAEAMRLSAAASETEEQIEHIRSVHDIPASDASQTTALPAFSRR